MDLEGLTGTVKSFDRAKSRYIIEVEKEDEVELVRLKKQYVRRLGTTSSVNQPPPPKTKKKSRLRP